MSHATLSKSFKRDQQFSKRCAYQTHLNVELKQQFLDPALRVSDTVGVGWGPTVCSSNKFPGEGEAAEGEQATLGRTLPFL